MGTVATCDTVDPSSPPQQPALPGPPPWPQAKAVPSDLFSSGCLLLLLLLPLCLPNLHSLRHPPCHYSVAPGFIDTLDVQRSLALPRPEKHLGKAGRKLVGRLPEGIEQNAHTPGRSRASSGDSRRSPEQQGSAGRSVACAGVLEAEALAEKGVTLQNCEPSLDLAATLFRPAAFMRIATAAFPRFSMAVHLARPQNLFLQGF